MNGTTFINETLILFGQALGCHGFEHVGRHCTFVRWVSANIVHVILAAQFRSRVRHRVHVFATSPNIELFFEEKYPEALSIPSESFSYLNQWTGVGPDQQMFSCETVAALRSGFEAQVKELLLTKAIPYLDRIQTVADMIPLIRHPLPLGLAMLHVGRVEDARRYLESELARLIPARHTHEMIGRVVERISDLLVQAEARSGTGEEM